MKRAKVCRQRTSDLGTVSGEVGAKHHCAELRRKLYAACMAVQQAMGMQSLAKERGVVLGSDVIASQRECNYWDYWQERTW